MSNINETVSADWTTTHDRRIASPEPMLISGVISSTISTFPVSAPVQTSPSDPSTVATGHCYCGKLQLELPLATKPALSVVCHCADCREWHSVGSLPYMMFPLDVGGDEKGGELLSIPIRLLSAPSLLSFVHRTPQVRRYYASCCGTRLFNAVVNPKLGLKLCGTFPTVFPDYEWKPTMHVNVREGNDLDYPPLGDARWADLPGAFGGTGRQIGIRQGA